MPVAAAFRSDNLAVRVFDDRAQLGPAAAALAAGILERRIQAVGHARVYLSAGSSQLDMIDALVHNPGLNWKAVEVFHIDEYVGMPASHPASFRRWVNMQLADRVHPGVVHYLAGDAADLDAECRRYAALLAAMPIDLGFLGFGENGHIGFNDPHEANFADPLPIRQVTLDEVSRGQQVREGHFPNLDAVPKEAVTLTCPTLMAARHIIACVPELRKAEAVRKALEGPISQACPASVIRTHPNATLFLDRQSSSLLSNAAQSQLL